MSEGQANQTVEEKPVCKHFQQYRRGNGYGLCIRRSADLQYGKGRCNPLSCDYYQSGNGEVQIYNPQGRVSLPGKEVPDSGRPLLGDEDRVLVDRKGALDYSALEAANAAPVGYPAGTSTGEDGDNTVGRPKKDPGRRKPHGGGAQREVRIPESLYKPIDQSLATALQHLGLKHMEVGERIIDYLYEHRPVSRLLADIAELLGVSTAELRAGLAKEEQDRQRQRSKERRAAKETTANGALPPPTRGVEPVAAAEAAIVEPEPQEVGEAGAVELAVEIKVAEPAPTSRDKGYADRPMKEEWVAGISDAGLPPALSNETLRQYLVRVAPHRLTIAAIVGTTDGNISQLKRIGLQRKSEGKEISPAHVRQQPEGSNVEAAPAKDELPQHKADQVEPPASVEAEPKGQHADLVAPAAVEAPEPVEEVEVVGAEPAVELEEAAPAPQPSSEEQEAQPTSDGAVDSTEGENGATADQEGRERDWQWDDPISPKYRSLLLGAGLYVPDDPLLTYRMFLVTKDPQTEKEPNCDKVAHVLGISDRSVKNARQVARQWVAKAEELGISVSDLDTTPDRSQRGVPWRIPIAPELLSQILEAGLPKPDEGETLEQYLISGKSPSSYKLAAVLGLAPQSVVGMKERALRRANAPRAEEAKRIPEGGVHRNKNTPWDEKMTEELRKKFIEANLPFPSEGMTIREYLCLAFGDEINYTAVGAVVGVKGTTVKYVRDRGLWNLETYGYVMPDRPVSRLAESSTAAVESVGPTVEGTGVESDERSAELEALVDLERGVPTLLGTGEQDTEPEPVVPICVERGIAVEPTAPENVPGPTGTNPAKASEDSTPRPPDESEEAMLMSLTSGDNSSSVAGEDKTAVAEIGQTFAHRADPEVLREFIESDAVLMIGYVNSHPDLQRAFEDFVLELASDRVKTLG